MSGPLKGRKVDDIPYEDISKLSDCWELFVMIRNKFILYIYIEEFEEMKKIIKFKFYYSSNIIHRISKGYVARNLWCGCNEIFTKLVMENCAPGQENMHFALDSKD